MCFNNNVMITFQLMEGEQQTGPIFGEWLAIMDIFKREPELRRIIFGLNAIVRIENPSNLPPIVQERIGQIGHELSKLVVRVDGVRRKTLKDNEEHVAKGGFGSEDDE